MLRGNDVSSRGAQRIKPDSRKPFEQLRQLQGLRGAHRHTVLRYLQTASA
jgi:hypothetical protein